VQKFRSLAASSTDFDLTGQIVWGAAKTLAALIVARNEEFRLKNVLELGAGAGLSGLVASQYA
jgi:predicted nicotinamide N-methyase